MSGFERFMVGALLSLALISCGRAQKTTADGVDHTPVPQEYRTLYNELAVKLDHLGKGVKSQWNGKKAVTPFGVELLVANSNLGTTDVWSEYCGTAGKPGGNGENKPRPVGSGETGLLDSVARILTNQRTDHLRLAFGSG